MSGVDIRTIDLSIKMTVTTTHLWLCTSLSVWQQNILSKPHRLTMDHPQWIDKLVGVCICWGRWANAKECMQIAMPSVYDAYMDTLDAHSGNI